MAKLYISEYAQIAQSAAGAPQVGQEPSLVEQVLDISGTHAQSAAFNEKTNFIRVQTDVICSLKFGVDPTAVTTEKRLIADGHLVGTIRGTPD